PSSSVLSYFLNFTWALVDLSDTQVMPFSLGDLEALSPSKQAIILLLCSTLYAVSNIAQAMQEVHLDFMNFRVQMINASLPGNMFTAIQASLHDLSFHVAAPV